MKYFKLFVTAVAAIVPASCQRQEEVLPDNVSAGIAGKITVCAEMPSTRTVMDNYKNAANYDAFRVFWQGGDVIEGVAWQGDDAAWWENAQVLTIPALTEDDLTEENKKATFTIGIPDGFDVAQPLKIALFYVKDANNDTYSDTYRDNPVSFSIPNRGLTWHNAQMVKTVPPPAPWELPDYTYLTNRMPMMARTELPSGWTQAGQSISVPFKHLTTLFGFKIYNTTDADLDLTGLELSVSNHMQKMFLADGAVIDPISGSAVPDGGKTAATAISGITDNTIAPTSAETYCLPCIVTGDMTGVEYSFKVNGQTAVTKTGKNYKPGVCYSMDIQWDGTHFSLLDHSQSMMYSYILSEDGKTLLKWTGNESFVDMNLDPRLAEVTTIDGYDDDGWHMGAFANNKSIKKIIIGNQVTTIKTEAFIAFEGSEEIHIPASVTTIEEGAFRWTSGAFTVDPANQDYCSEEGVLFNKAKTELLRFPEIKGGDYTVPATVSKIETEAFSSCYSLTSIVLSPALTEIGYDAFSYCDALLSVDFSPCTSLTTIDNIFSNCTELEWVHIPGSVTTLCDNALSTQGNKLSTVIIDHPSSLQSIGNNAFGGCAFTHFVIPSGVTTLDGGAFSSCRQLQEVSLPETIIRIHEGTFFRCSSLNSITIPANVTDIDNLAFYDNHLNAVYASPVTAPRLNGTAVFTVFNEQGHIVSPTATLYNISEDSQTDYLNMPPWNGASNASLWEHFPMREIMTPSSVSPNRAGVAATGGTISVNVTTDAPWSAVSSQDWLTAVPQSGSGNETLAITAAANTTGRPRVAHIVITATAAPTRLVEVVQGK
ncbi:MAG: leucine-rich repeat protein [Candidatus Cryptobacteroides sp.]|jgi:hypothetical protein